MVWTIDWQWVVGGSAATVCTLIAAVYAEPRSYDALLKPVLKYLSIIFMVLGLGAYLGQIYLFDALQPFIAASKISEAKKVLDDAKAMTQIGQIAALLVFLFNIVLYIIALKAQEWKLDRQTP